MTSVNAQSAAPDHQTPPGPAPVQLKQVYVSLRSRIIVWLLRQLLRPWLAWMSNGSLERMAKMQLQMAAQICKDSSGLPLEYTVLGRVPGHLVGNIRHVHKPVILYIHGGAFIIPAVPATHVWLMARMCRELDAVGFMVDYRLAPGSKFPAALDDCERAYRALLNLGFPASRIVITGESAGGNLTLGLLQRIRKHGLPMPSCAVPVSPATEMGRIHAPPSRALKRNSDPILPIATLQRVSQLYAGDWDTSDPELSPLYMDCSGLPPLYFLATDNEVLLDDTVLLARRAHEQGVQVKLDVWPIFPHAFPLFGQLFPEVRQARKDMVAFMREQLDKH